MLRLRIEQVSNQPGYITQLTMCSSTLTIAVCPDGRYMINFANVQAESEALVVALEQCEHIEG